MRKGIPLTPYNRSRFYGPFEDNVTGYTDYLTAEQQKEKEGKNGVASA